MFFLHSRFTKNLSPSKINVSTLKGEGNLSNLELDELVLTDLMDLPTWLKISRASCNKVAIKVRRVLTWSAAEPLGSSAISRCV